MWRINSKWKFFTIFVTLIASEFASGTDAQEFQCYVCSSNNLEACSVNDQQNEVDLPFETCSSNIASCFTKVENGITYRGCLSHDRDHNDSATFNCDDTTDCIKCYSDKCNGNAKNIDFNPFQENVADNGNSVDEKEPFTCISCDSDLDPSCSTNSTFKYFDNCRYPHKCYHYIIESTGQHKRGCTKHLPKKLVRLCEEGDGECKTCVDSNCNSEKSFKKCLYCTTVDGWQCATKTHKIKSKACKLYNSDCFTYIGRQSVSRGCMEDQSTIFESVCKGNPKKCSICNTDDGNGCNKQRILLDKCIDCDSRTGDKCRENPDLYEDKVCSDMKTLSLMNDLEGCYMRVENDYVQRGCLRDLEPETKSFCKNNTDICKICFGSNCNRIDNFTKCYECNSKDDITCSGNSTLSNSVICKSYYGMCSTGIDVNGYTQRKCGYAHWSEDDGLGPDKRIELCKGTNCNTVIYPPDRLHCYNCNGEDECNFLNESTNSLVPIPCARISEPEQCYTYRSEDNKMYRGCLADNDEHRALCDEENPYKRGSCIKCGEFGCNNEPKVKPPSLSCIKCDKSEECAFGQVETTPCQNEVLFGFKESCYTHYNADERWATRGCTIDISDAIDSTENIEICSGFGCNSDNILHSQCVSCESDVDGECGKVENKDSFMKKCEGTYPHEKRGCYTLVKNDIVSRGCIKDLEQSDYQATQNGTQESSLCLDDGCNDQFVKNDRLCYECDSKTDPKCINQIDSSMLKRCPDSEEDLGCFHQITETGMMRGCVANLEGEEKENCLENDKICKSCLRNGCNRKRAFAECMVTNGVVHVKYKPKQPFDDKLFTKICKKYDDSCFVLANDLNIVFRDCLSEYSEKNEVSINFLSEHHNSTSYEVCSEPLCNDHDIQPFYCLSCDSRYDGNCMNTSSSERKRCSLEVNPSGCYHFDGNHIERGCITDLDEEKRELCESDSETCKKCIGNECNSKAVFQKCLATDGEGFNNKTCKRYTDECFIHVSDNNVRRGCVSDLIESPIDGIDIVADCENDEICEKCSDRNNCNDREIEGEYCLVCTSTDDLFCLHYPESLNASEQCPLTLKQIGCYLQQDGFWYAERGCMSHLDSTRQLGCKTSNSTCKMCLGNNCNEKRRFQTCADCNSKVDGKDCIDKAFIAKIRTCDDYHGECYTQVENADVIRNCTGDNIIPNADTCKENPDNCKLCSDSSFCNDRTIRTLKCVTCDSLTDSSCASNTTFEKFSTCPLSVHEPNCYHMIDGGQIHRRGCTNLLTKLQKESCERNGDQCKICSGDNCNTRPSFERCYNCDSTKYPNCFTNLEKTHSKICKDYDDECFTHIGDSDIVRGCLKEQNFRFQSICRNNNENKCATCTTKEGLGCNEQKLNIEYCAHCNSEKDENCRDQPESFKDRLCSKFALFDQPAPKEGCYMFEENNKTIKRGCVTDLRQKVKSSCLRQSENCKTCFGKNCNMKKELQKCYATDGRLHIYSQFNDTIKTCKHYTDACFTVFVDRLTVIKDCLNEYAENNNLPINFLSEKYKINQYGVCSGPLCNYKRIMETDCVTCDSRYDLDCRGPFSTAQLRYHFHTCPLEVNPSGCYHYEGNYTRRGCIGDLKSEERILCESDGKICKKCMGNQCNDRDYFQNCITDNKQVPDVTKSKTCKRYLDTCIIHLSGHKVRRGCKSDFTETPGNDIDFAADSHNELCKICYGRENCNDMSIINEYCAICYDRKNCTYAPNIDMIQKCPLSLKHLGCYLYKDAEGFAERGCMSNLMYNEKQKECQEGNGQCKMCTGHSCNMKKTFQVCRACDSSNDLDGLNCISTPWNMEEITCANYTDKCYTYVKNGTVKRNCIGDKIVPSVDDCTKNPNNCQICSDKDSCNDIVLKHETCISCNSSIDASCASSLTFKSFEECPFLINCQTCYHHIDKNTGVHTRGCVKNLIEPMLSLCERNSDECKTCEGTNCNNRNLFKRCMHCSTTEDENCAENPRNSYTKFCKHFNDECFTKIGTVGVLRGCLNEYSMEFIKSCRDNPDKCGICSADNESICNNKPIKIDTCNQCFSEDGDDECLNKPDKYRDRICSGINSTEVEGCYFHKSGNYIRRGCVQDLEGHLKPFCLDQSDTCKTCKGKNCNSMIDFRSCYVADGDISSTNNTKKTKVCKKFDDKCFSMVTENETIIKDCLTEYTEKNDVPIDFYAKKYNDSFYRECSSTNCNDDDIKPFVCIECDTRRNETCWGTAFAKRITCPLEVVPSGCYHHQEGKHVHRGCITHLNKEKRELCESDSEKCKRCVENVERGCNWLPFYQTCITTNPQNVSDSQSKTCKRYTDKCFTYVRNETIRRGCISDITESTNYGIGIDIKDCDDDDGICEKCNLRDDCNNREITHEHCIVCSTATDKSCSYFTEGFETKCPLTVKHLGCYLKIDKQYNVDRGCMSELKPKRREYCRSGNGICKMCMDDNCNKKRNFQRCFECDSHVDGEYCLLDPSKLKDKLCPNYLDHCYVQAIDGRIKRNCIGDDTIPTIVKCERNSKYCKHCDDRRGCNGKQFNKVTCISCNSTIDPACATNTTFNTFETCPHSVNENECYHMINATTREHTRGCLPNLPDPMIKLCEKNGDECKVCTGSNCNSRPSFIACLDCHTSDDRQCAINPQLAESKTCKYYYDKCYTYIGRFNVSRGCKSDRDKSFTNHCTFNPNKCELCDTINGNGCNNRTIAMETCVECNSGKNPKCRDQPDEFKDKVCSGLKTEDRPGCFLRVYGDHYDRGCIRDLRQFELADCQAQTNYCKTCEGKNCNLKKKFQECIHCNSRDHIECTHNATIKTSQICENYLSTCMTGIDSHGHTRRRCSSSYIDDDIEFPNTMMSVCRPNKCNTDIFPKDRLQCWRCDDCDFTPNNSTELTKNSVQLVPCGILSTHDQCYSYLGENNKIYRGCLTDTSDHRLLCEMEDPNKKDLCVKCTGTGCNNVARIRPTSLSCIQCDKSVECAFGQDKKNATKCKTDVSFGDEESCYTHYSLDGSWAERGCALDAKKPNDSNEDTEFIEFCGQSGCNTENVLRSQCVSCKSGFDGQCATITDVNSLLKQCKGSYSYEKRGCYTMLKNITIHRGCIKDLSKDDYEKCQNEENCELCTEDGCNIHAKGSSGRITANFLVIAFIICISLFFKYQ